MREPSASQIALASICQHPFTSGIEWPYEPDTAFAGHGKSTHKGGEALITGEAVYPGVYAGMDEASATKVDRCVEQINRWLDHEGRASWLLVLPEFRLGYFVETGAVRVTDKGSPKETGEWTVEIDLLFVDASGRLHVVDYKTGRQLYTDKAEKNKQLRLGAIAASKHLGYIAVTVHLLHVEEDAARDDWHEFDELDLETIASEMRSLRRKLTGGPTPPIPGSHCTQMFCKLSGICSATQSALATIQPMEDRLTVDIRSPEHARWIRERLPGAEAALGAIKKALNEYAKHTPIDMGNGRVFAWKERSERELRIDKREQIEALKGVLGEHARTAISIEYNVTLTSLREACRQAAEADGGTIKAFMARALQALEDTGALTVKQWSSPMEFKVEAA